jgi:MFS family permease
MWRKWTVTLLTSFGGLVTLMSGTMIAPALGQISKDLHASESTMQMTLSIYVLSFAFGPMILAPMTEVFGRKPVWLVAGSFYIVWNTVCGFSHSNGLMVASRFLSGLGASAEYAARRVFMTLAFVANVYRSPIPS